MRHEESDFAGLARRIQRWTVNFLATAIVLVGGLALGRQVIGWWHEAEPTAPSADAALAAANLPDLGEGREFLTRHGALKIERVSGGRPEALAAMQSFCRSAPVAANPSPAAAKAETEIVTKLAAQAPLEETGEVSLYQPHDQTSMVVAVHRPAGRIVAWSFALPIGESRWSIYHFRPQAADARLSTWRK